MDTGFDRPRPHSHPSEPELFDWYQAYVVEGRLPGTIFAVEGADAPDVPMEAPDEPPSIEAIREAYGYANRLRPVPDDGQHTAHTSLFHRVRHRCGWRHH